MQKRPAPAERPSLRGERDGASKACSRREAWRSSAAGTTASFQLAAPQARTSPPLLQHQRRQPERRQQPHAQKNCARALRCLSSSAVPERQRRLDLGRLAPPQGRPRPDLLPSTAGLKLFGSGQRRGDAAGVARGRPGKWSSRQERQAMQRSVGELARVVPLAGLFLVFGLELTTVAIRLAPSLLPKSMRQRSSRRPSRWGSRRSVPTRRAHRPPPALCADLVGGAQQIADDHIRAPPSCSRASATTTPTSARIPATTSARSRSSTPRPTLATARRWSSTPCRRRCSACSPSSTPRDSRLLGPSPPASRPTLRRRLLREKINSLRDDDKELYVGRLRRRAQRRRAAEGV